MAAVVAQFFGIVGVDAVPPDNLAQLIPYLLQVLVGVVLVLAVFKVVFLLVSAFMDWGRWR